MKKFYTLLAAAVVALSASAASHSLEAVKEHSLKPMRTEVSKLKTARTAAVVSEPIQKNAIAGNSKPMRAVKKAPAADASIEGTWTFYLGDYYFQNSTLETLEVEFEATVENGKVWFEDPTGYELPIIADYNEATGTLTFKEMYLGTLQGYYVYLRPFVWSYTLNDVEYKNIIGQFTGSEIEFEPDNGVDWAACTAQNIDSQKASFGMYDLEGAERAVEWIVMEDATFNENIIYYTFKEEKNTVDAEVVVLENPNEPGVYKVKDPFKTLYAAFGFKGASPDMVIDARNPDNVIIEMQATGISGGEIDGAYYYFNEAWYSDLLGEEVDPELICKMTTDENGVSTITMPYRSCSVMALTSLQLYYGSEYESVLKFKKPVAGTITVGEVTYNAYPNMSVGFTVPVETEGLADDAVVTVYYKGPNDDDFVDVEENHGYNFVIEDLEADTDYTVTIYAASGDVKSEEVEVEFHTYKVETEETTAEVIHHVADNITDTSADINVSYGFKGIPEGAKASVLVKGENFKEYKVEIEEPVYGQTVTISVTDLTAGTTYQYQAVAQLETADGNIITRDAQYGEFTTLTEAEASIAVPEFNPADGSVVAPYEYIEITAEEGCDIYYMVEDYDDDFVKYDAEEKVMVPYTATESLTVKAYAEKDGVKSRVVSATYKVDKIDPQLEWIDADGEYVPELTVDMSDEAPEYPVLDGIIEGGVVYSSSDETVATIDAEGKITLVAAGTTFITATSNETATYKSAETSYKLIVTDAKSGIFTIGVDGESVRYFDINGIEVKSPAAGRPYIKVVGNKAVKVLVK